jgi:PAS domain S-box-containing protein
MRIRTQFIIPILLFGIILVVIAASAIITHQKLEKASQQENLASNIAQGAGELSYLSNDYLIYRESQQLKRWQSRFALLSNQVASLNVDKPEQQVLVRNIKANEQRLKQVFDSVASAVGGPSQNRSTALDLAFLQVSWSRMAVQSQGLVSDASRLSQLLHQQMDELTETRTILMYVMIGLFGAFLLASYMLTYRKILKSIATLQAGTNVIGSGNLDFKIEERKKDEIGDLSRAFNQMTANLKDVTASKSELEREIAERKRAEEELRQQREWLRVTLSSIGDAVIATDIEGRITFLNPVAVTLTGWQLEETLGQPIQSVFRIINEKTHAPAEDLVARVLSEKRAVGLANDTALLTKDGQEVPIEDSAAPIKDATGNVTGVVLVFHDVTEKRRAQATLRESEERFRAVFESSSDCILVWDRQYNYLYANQAAIDHVGTTRDKVIGKNIRDGLGHVPDFMQLWMGRVDRAFATGESFRVEDAVTVGDRLVHSESQVSPIRDAAGQVFAVGVVYRDNTERKRAEEVLREAHERAIWLARFPEQNPNPIIRGSADGTVLYCNPASARLHGWKCEVGGVLQNELLPLISRAMAEGREVQEDVQLGERFYIVWVAPFPEEGYANIYGRDITERKQAEDALRQRTLELQQLTETLDQQVRERTEELEVINEELRNRVEECQTVQIALRKSETSLRHLSIELLSSQEKERKLVAGEIHDSIGSSLAAIKFKVENALTEVTDKSPETTTVLQTVIPIIQGAIDEARRIQMNLRPSILDDLGILATIRWLCRQFESTYSKIRISQSIEIEEHEVPPPLRTVIFRVLQEGLNNVAKHSKAKMVMLLLRRAGQRVQLVIQDNGQGFDVSKAQSPSDTAHGLGLNSMKERTEFSGGTFEIESTQRKGTTIRASWPI